MAIDESLVRTLESAAFLSRARVTAVDADGGVHVAPLTNDRTELVCHVLRVGRVATPCAPGDVVLVARTVDTGDPAVVLGIVEPARPASHLPIPSDAAIAQTRVIEASDELILKCGEASITISADGKIVIRGQHILSRAKGTHRIKGGSVAIN